MRRVLRALRCAIFPAYSTERVAHTAIMMLLNFASTMQQQIGMLARGDRSNFTKHLQVSHTEVNGKNVRCGWRWSYRYGSD